MNEFTKFKIVIVFELFSIRYLRQGNIDVPDLVSLRQNIYSLLDSCDIFDVEDFCSQLRLLYIGSPVCIYRIVRKYIKYLKAIESIL